MQSELIIFPIILSITHYIGQRWDVQASTFKLVRSFAAGLSVAYVFLILMPELLSLQVDSDMRSFMTILVGFTIFHVVLKYVNKSADLRLGKLASARIHGGVLIMYYFITAFILMQVAQRDLAAGFAVLIPLAAHSLLSEIVIAELNERLELRLVQFLILLSPLVGGFISIAGSIPAGLVEMLMGLGVGAILYISVEEEIPQGKAGRPLLFLSGVMVMILWILSF